MVFCVVVVLLSCCLIQHLPTKPSAWCPAIIIGHRSQPAFFPPVKDSTTRVLLKIGVIRFRC